MTDENRKQYGMSMYASREDRDTDIMKELESLRGKAAAFDFVQNELNKVMLNTRLSENYHMGINLALRICERAMKADNND